MIVRVRDDFHEGLGELIAAILKMTGVKAVQQALGQFICGKIAPGHSFKVVVIHTDTGFLADPTTACLKCGAAMSTDAYDQMVIEYARALAERTAHSDEEDEVW